MTPSPSILILGAGSHARAVAELAADCGYHSADFLDDAIPVAVAPLADFERLAPTYSAVAIAIGNLPVRKALLDRLVAVGAPCPPLIHSTAYVSPSACIAPAALVFPRAVVHANSVVEAGAIVSAGAVVDHDATLGFCSHLDAGAVLASRASVPPLTKVLAGSRILPDTPEKGHFP
jgi:UDP-3-O-[3-hydroxymyristoyl] glucosamine N-acyltransferase